MKMILKDFIMIAIEPQDNLQEFQDSTLHHKEETMRAEMMQQVIHLLMKDQEVDHTIQTKGKRMIKSKLKIIRNNKIQNH